MGVKEIEIADRKFTIHELDDVYDLHTGRPLTGSWLWGSSLVLSRFLASHNLSDKSVLELGAGAGLPGLTAARVGASKVVLTDVGALLPGLVKNVEANGLEERVKVKELVWGEGEGEGEGEGKYDVVLMSDVFFDPEEMGSLGRTIERVCKEGTVVWAATQLRPWTGECLYELASRGFQVLDLLFPGRPDVSLGRDDDDDDDGDPVFAIYQLVPPTLLVGCEVDEP